MPTYQAMKVSRSEKRRDQGEKVGPSAKLASLDA
jgi:hypothetical protein